MINRIVNVGCVILLLSIMVTNSGCEKWRDNRETVTCFDHALAEASFNDIFRNIMLITSTTGGLITDTCYTLTWSGPNYPRTAVFDFGSSYCEGLYGPPTTGSFSVMISDTFSNTGATATATVADLSIDGYKVQGEVVVTNLGNVQYSVAVNNGAVTISEDEIVSWGCSYTYKLIEINVVDIIFDDLYQITGKANGVNHEGRDFEVNIKEPMLKELDCRWMRSGVLEVLPSDLKDRELDYGNPECEQNSNCCDNEADVTINDRKEYTLRMK